MFIIAYVGTALIITIIVMGISAYLARRKGKNPAKWALLSAFSLFVFVFWDYYPTKWTHQYYCEKEAGFWVYKTLNQWKAENPGVMETLVYNKAMPYVQTPYGVANALNLRFIYIYKYEGPFLFNRWRVETEIRDSKNGEVIAREVGFSTSQIRRQAGWSGWKFWLDREHCKIENHRDQGSFDKVTSQFEGSKK